MPLTAHERNVLVAALGPTNTGKTHRAVERMLEHETGMIGLPLRLLAREIYDRVSARLGESRVALVTGEEKRVPTRPSYWVCTTEAMPVGLEVDFVAVDEIQLAAHPQRGHVFTDRLLRAQRTARDLVHGVGHDAFVGGATGSHGQGRGASEILELDERRQHHAQRAASAYRGGGVHRAQVYEIAERLRARRGGAAVVLGALSPRTRNAQVALYQSGEVQYLVATDAIGMGLNMDVDLVAFAAVRKFDGRDIRALEPAELGQIAGRAGRHLRDGTFATLAPLPPLADDLVFALETHRFTPVQRVYWRNSEVDLASIDALIASLHQRSPRANLRRVEYAEDLAALAAPRAGARGSRAGTGREAVGLLWEVCRIPDYRQLLAESHAKLLEEIFLQLAARSATLDPAWMHERIVRLDRHRWRHRDLDGAHRVHPNLDLCCESRRVGARWAAVARADTPDRGPPERRAARAAGAAVRGAGPGKTTSASRRRPGLAPRASEQDSPVVAQGPFRALASLKLRTHVEPRAPVNIDDEQWTTRVVEAPHEAFRVDDAGRILWDGTVIARMLGGVDMLRPDVALQLDGDLGPGARARIQRRLVAFTRDFLRSGAPRAAARSGRSGALASRSRACVPARARAGHGHRARRPRAASHASSTRLATAS